MNPADGMRMLIALLLAVSVGSVVIALLFHHIQRIWCRDEYGAEAFAAALDAAAQPGETR